MELFDWFLVGLVIVGIFAVIDNISANSIKNINLQLRQVTCPLPVTNAKDNLFIYNNQSTTSVQFGNFTYCQGNCFGTYYACTQDISGNQQIIISNRPYNATVSAFPSGWFVYVGDVIGALVIKLGAIANLILYFLTPINFSILGHTITEISGIGLFFVIAVFVFAYIPIGLYSYKAISPFVK